MYQVEVKESSVEFLIESKSIDYQYSTGNPKKNKSKDLSDYENLSEDIIDKIYDEIREFVHLYLFSGEISTNDLNIKLEDLFEMDDNDLITLKTVHFLLSDKVRDLIQILPVLLRNLSHSTKKEKEEFRGVVRGRIDWNATLKTRYAKGFNDPSLFVCSPPSKFYDLEENQLLKFVLRKIISLKNNYLDFVNYTKNDEENPFDIEKLSDEKNWYEIVGNNYKMAKKTLKKVYFNDISDIKVPKSKHIRKAFKNRNPLYHRIAEVYLLYEDLFINEDTKVLECLINDRLIRATNPHKLYEIYVFFSLVRALPDPDLTVLSKGYKYFTFDELDDGTEVTIHYQHLPDDLREASEYKDILDNYDIRNSYRDPDIILEFEKDGIKTFRIVEVKNTSKTDYVRDSLYKVMGYYHDYEKILHNKKKTFTDKCPVVLVTWGGINIKEGCNPFEKDIIILNIDEFEYYLKKLVGLEEFTIIQRN